MFTDKFDVLFVRLNEKNYSTWAFQLEIFVKGNELWGHVDGTDPAPNKTTHKDAHAKWEANNAQVMAVIIRSVDPNIFLNLRPFATTAKMWEYLKTNYSQNNSAREFQLEHEISVYRHESLSISELYFHFMNLWAEYTGIVYKDLSVERQTVVQTFNESTKRDQFLMKLRFDFEGIQTNVMNKAIVPSLDECLNDLLREEQRLLTQATMDQKKSTSFPVAYVA